MGGQKIACGSKRQRAAGRSALWLVPIDGGEPRRLDIDVDDWTLSNPDDWLDGGFALSPDGRRIAYIVGKNTVEVWALENVIPARERNSAR